MTTRPTIKVSRRPETAPGPGPELSPVPSSDLVAFETYPPDPNTPPELAQKAAASRARDRAIGWELRGFRVKTFEREIEADGERVVCHIVIVRGS